MDRIGGQNTHIAAVRVVHRHPAFRAEQHCRQRILEGRHTHDCRRWWGESWAARVLESDLARAALAKGLATPADLQSLSQAWLDWSCSDDGWFTVPHGEILAAPAS